MSEPSAWPLKKGATRIVVPRGLVHEMQQHVLCRECYPTAMGFYPYAREHAMQRSQHDDYLVIACERGRGQLWLDSGPHAGFSAQLAAGDLVIVPPGMAHHYSASAHEPWSVFWCHFSGTRAIDFYQHIRFDAAQSPIPVVRGVAELSLLNSFSALLALSSEAFTMPVFVNAANQLRQVLTLIERIRARLQSAREEESLSEVQIYMRNNLHRRLTLDDLARVTQLSKYHFHRRYKAATGYTPMQHVIHLRIEQACYLLQSTHMSIATIAQQVGYDDALYFSRIFRKCTGQAPSDYRRQGDN